MCFKLCCLDHWGFPLCILSKVQYKKHFKGYTEQQDDCQESEGWHVVANRNKLREGRHEVEEVGLMEAL